MKRYVSLLLTLGFLLSLLSLTTAGSAEVAQNYQFETALKLAKILDRQFVFVFVQPGCPHCQEFKEEFLSKPEIKSLLEQHFVLSLVNTDKTFTIDLPVQGEVTNRELASGLGVRVTPTTFIFYPPDPGLLREGGGITKFKSIPLSPEDMENLLIKVTTESFGEEEQSQDGEDSDEDKVTFYNYKNPIKVLEPGEFEFLRGTSFGIPVVESKVELSSLPSAPEVIIGPSADIGKDYLKDILGEAGIKKVYLVEEGER